MQRAKQPRKMLLQPLYRAALVATAISIATPCPAQLRQDAESYQASGEHGAVAAEHRLASQAGVEILRAGGNAVDAAVAAALATAVVNPSSSGLGGGGFMVIYLAAERRAHALDYRERAPAAARRDMYVHDGQADSRASREGGLAVAVPGEAAGLELALQRFGKLDMARVAAPAIRLATEGFTVEDHLASTIERKRDLLAADPVLSRIFLHEDGSPYRAGEHLWRSDLAASLELLSARGAGPFYRGEIARDIVATVAAAGGILSEEDLASYKALQRSPLLVDYEGFKLITMPPPSSGGGTMAEALGVLAPYSLSDLGRQSSTYLHLLAEVFKAVFADRAAYYGDPDFVKIPIERLTASAHINEIRNGLSAVRPVPSSHYGTITPPAVDSGTTHISVIDSDGNAVACSSSVNTAFGSGLGVPGRGIVLNNTMDDFSIQPGVANAFGLVGNEANAVASGKRPLSSMSPTIVLDHGRVRLVAGASGGPLIITATVQTILNVIEFGLDAAAAVAAPRLHHQWIPEVLAVEEQMPVALRESLARRGHKVKVLPAGAAVQAVELVEKNGHRFIRAASDPRKGGVAAAY